MYKAIQNEVQGKLSSNPNIFFCFPWASFWIVLIDRSLPNLPWACINLKIGVRNQATEGIKILWSTNTRLLLANLNAPCCIQWVFKSFSFIFISLASYMIYYDLFTEYSGLIVNFACLTRSNKSVVMRWVPPITIQHSVSPQPLFDACQM